MTWRTHREIFVLMAVFLAIGLGYNLTIPLFEAPSEGSHFRYARHIAEGRGLPSIPDDEQFPQEHQAPLYYLITGLLISPLDLSQPPPPQPNPYHVYNNPGPIEDNRNSYYHYPHEAFPYRGMVLGVHVGRLVALAMGAATVLATYAVAYELLAGSELTRTYGEAARSNCGAGETQSFAGYPLHKALALGAAALTAFNPQFVFISSVMSNDTTAAAFSGWALFLALRILYRGLTWRRSLLLGGALGLAALSKLNGLAMLAIAMLALALAGLPALAPFQDVWDLPRPQGPRRRGVTRGIWLAHTLLVAALAGLIAAWWYVRNWVLYRDPFTLKLASERWGTGGVTRSFGEIVRHWREIEVGFWGLFGHDNLLMDPVVYDVLHAVEVLAGLGLLVWSARIWYAARRKPGVGPSAGQSPAKALTPALVSLGAGLALVALTCAAALAGLYRWLQVTDLPAGRYLYPALAAINVILFFGLSGLVPTRLTPWLAGGVAAGLLTLALVAPIRSIMPAYARPPLVSQEAAIPQRVDISFTHPQLTAAGRIQLIGYAVREDTVQPGDWVHVTLYWRTSERVQADLTVALRLLGQDGEIVGSKDSYPGLGRYPTSLWQPDLVVQDTYPVQVAFDARTPTRLSFDVNLYYQPTMGVLPKQDQAGRPVGQLALGEARLIAASSQPPSIPNSTRFTLGSELQMIGYSLGGTAPYPPGSALDLTLYWQSLAAISRDYTVFIHLLDGGDRAVAGWDAPPVNGNYPTHLWAAEEIVEDAHRLTLPADLAAGEYRLVAGLYQLETQQRLPVADELGHRALNDSVPLLTLTVGEAGR